MEVHSYFLKAKNSLNPIFHISFWLIVFMNFLKKYLTIFIF